MTFSDDFRWRAVALLHLYKVPIVHVSEVFGPKQRTIRRWYSMFIKDGVVREDADKQKHCRWPADALAAVEASVKQLHLTFYIEESQDCIRKQFPNLTTASTASICRVSNFDQNFTNVGVSSTATSVVVAAASNVVLSSGLVLGDKQSKRNRFLSLTRSNPAGLVPHR